jgi:hypothetical protein
LAQHVLSCSLPLSVASKCFANSVSLCRSAVLSILFCVDPLANIRRTVLKRRSLSDQLLNLGLVIALGNEAEMRECDPP